MIETADDIRPPLARLAEKVILQELRGYQTLLNAALAAAKAEPPAGLWGADSDCAAGNDGAVAAVAWGSEHVQRWALSVRDHAETLLLLLRHQRLLPLPAWTVARAIFEAVLQTCWLLDANVPSEARIARAASVLPASLNESIVLLARFGSSQEELEEKRQTRAELERKLIRDGFRVDRETDKKGRRTEGIGRVWFEGESASTKNNISQLASKYMPHEPWLYGLLSGAAHSKPWLLTGLSDDTDETIRSLVMPLLPMSDAYTRAWCGYFSIDAEPYLRARRMRLVALVEHGAPPRGIDRSVTTSAFGTRQKGLRHYEL